VHLLLEHFEDVPHDAVVDVEFPRWAVHARGIGATARRVPSGRGAPLMAATFSTLLYSITGWRDWLWPPFRGAVWPICASLALFGTRRRGEVSSDALNR
jgi:hypothetical protein